MAHQPEDIFAEFYIEGAWQSSYDGNDLTERVRGGDQIRITRGGSDQFSNVTSTSVQFTLNNRDNLFTDDDPMSPLYRKFGQYTRARFGITNARTLDLYANFSEIPSEASLERIETADKASLDITGDIDIRWEMDLRGTRDVGMILGGKYTTTGDQRSWVIWMHPQGRIGIRHFADGITSIDRASNNSIVSQTEVRKAYRLTLDVDDGAGNRVYRWYTSDSIDGSWTLIETSTVAGTTSLYSSTATLCVGTSNQGGQVFGGYTPFAGKMYRFQVYDGIGGTLVADFDPNKDSAGIGDTTWTDTCASPNTWTIEPGSLNAIRLGSDRIRATVEIQNRPDDWDPSGTDRWCAMTASGILAHYANRNSSIMSTERRYWTRLANQGEAIVGIWPCEDGREATQVSSALDPGRAGTIVNCSFSDADGFGGSSGALVLDESGGSSYADFYANTHVGSGSYGFMFNYKAEELPLSDSVILNLYPTGSTINRWVVSIADDTIKFNAYNGAGTELVSSLNVIGIDATREWVAVQMTFTQDGADIDWSAYWFAIGSNTVFAAGGTVSGATVGRVNRGLFNPTATELANVKISQFVMFNYLHDLATTDFALISGGYAGETFGRRWVRLLTEENIAHEWVGQLDETEECGPQPDDTLYNILAGGAKLDGGLVTEARDVVGLRYVSGRMIGNRRRLDLSYTGSELSETPRPTGKGDVVNDFTATRRDGGSGRYEATDNRRKNVRNPEDANPGVGRFERSDTYDAYLDSRMYQLASFRVFLGTWDERYIPTMMVSTHRSQIADNATLLERIFSQDLGDPISITDTNGTPMPPDDALASCTGYIETISNMLQDITFNTIPQGPYQTPVIQSYVTDYYPRLDVEGTESSLDADVNTTATSLAVRTLKTATPAVWVDVTNDPSEIGGGQTIDIDVGGERITVTSIAAPTSDATYNYQTFTVTRSVNGVVKSHSTGDVIKLFTPAYLGKI